MNLIGKVNGLCKVAKTITTILENTTFDGMRLSVECNGKYISASKENCEAGWKVVVRNQYDLDTVLGEFAGVEAERFVTAALETMSDDDLAYCQYHLDGHAYDYRPAMRKWVELY
jgi:hypothetical protein